ncbi:unnamed protein product [Closterium sp. Yama58-4]|nr:unnamed protein product [Closterium sp. Yama58-4]
MSTQATATGSLAGANAKKAIPSEIDFLAPQNPLQLHGLPPGNSPNTLARICQSSTATPATSNSGTRNSCKFLFQALGNFLKLMPLQIDFQAP